MSYPLVSIIIPTYNREHLILDTLNSVIAQTYKNWECIIVDDESSDNSEKIIKELIAKEPRIHFYKKPEFLAKGPSASRNFGYEKSKGLYINWLDSDDLLVPEKIETDIQFLIYSEYDFTISQSEFFNEQGQLTNRKWNKKLFSGNPINDFIVLGIGWCVNSPLWKKASLERINLKFNSDLMTADDYFYHIEALAGSLKPKVINETMCFLREHPARLNNHPFKAPSKLKVNYYLIQNKTQLKLGLKTTCFLKRQFLNQFKSLLKNKKIKMASFYITKSSIYNFNIKDKLNLYILFLLGLFYKTLGFGYRFLK